MADLPVGDLAEVLHALLSTASPGLFAGTPPVVTLALANESLEFSANPKDNPSCVRRESRRESLALDPQHPLGPYRLSTPPAGHRVVRLLVGDAVALTFDENEVDWSSESAGQSFALTPRRHRIRSDATHIQVVYGANAATETLLGACTTTVLLSGAAAGVHRARDLTLAVVTLDSDQLIANVRTTSQEGNYTTTQRITDLALTGVESTSGLNDTETCRLTMRLNIQLELRRALREGEGAPIIRIATPAATGSGPVVIEPELDNSN